MTDSDKNRPDLAIALSYDGDNAPRITAKGRGDAAKQILALAAEHDVPLHEDPELSLLLAQIPLGDEIPEELYRAVAEVIAFAYLICGKRPAGWAHVGPDADEG